MANLPSGLREIVNIDVLEPHVALPAGMQLQSDRTIERLGAGVGEIQDRHAIQPRYVAVAHDFKQIVIPVVAVNHAFELGCGPRDPLASVAIDASGMSHHLIDFKLKAL